MYGLFETHVDVTDLNRSLQFYTAVLWERPRNDIRLPHFAFEVGLQELPALVSRLEEHGIEFRDFCQQRTTAPTVFGFIPAASLYFDDPDGHVLELLAPIAAAPRPDLSAVSWAE